MNKAELIAEVAAKAGLSKKDSERGQIPSVSAKIALGVMFAVLGLLVIWGVVARITM